MKKQSTAASAEEAIQTMVAQVKEKAQEIAAQYKSKTVRDAHVFLALYPNNPIALKRANALMNMQVIQDSTSPASARIHTYNDHQYERFVSMTEEELSKQLREKIQKEQRAASSEIAYTTNLTRKAMRGELEPCIGREKEIERIVEILSKRKKNNPALTGDPGVGKTALVEGLAQFLVDNPTKYPRLEGKQILQVDLNALVAGTMYRGQFEERLQTLMNAVIDSQYILFIDELHAIMGNGNNEGRGDTSNTIKPHLANGSITLIGATTIKEYKKHIEKDGALARRFDTLDIQEPDGITVGKIIERLIPLYEQHHGVVIPTSLIPTMYKYGKRYIPERKFPDKALDLLDALSLTTLKRSKASKPEATAEILTEVIETMGKISVTDAAVEEPKLAVYGQDEAIAKIYRAIRSASRLKEKEHPVPILLTGPTGSGKTFTVKQLSTVLARPLVKLDMSEYSEPHSISKLIGAPPGYVGYGEGGKLTEAVRRNPYSIILFDEIEKSHPAVRNALLQIFEDGVLSDSDGVAVDFKNTLIFMTSNISANVKVGAKLGFAIDEKAKSVTEDREKSEKAILTQFPSELVNRIEAIIEYNKLDDASLDMIFEDLLKKYTLSSGEVSKLREVYEAFKRNPDDRKRLDTYGARELKRLVNGNL